MKNISLKQFLESQISEGVYDKNIFKCVFLAGGPGSGKSYVTKSVLGSFGLKEVASDVLFEILLKRNNLGLKIADMEPDDYKKAMELRTNIAMPVTDKQMQSYIDNRLGFIVDGTGANYEKIKRVGDKLRDLGYDIYMVFVNTSLDIAIERNNTRPRSLTLDVIKSMWKDVQSNLGKFQNYFKPENFILVDNNDAKEELFTRVSKRIRVLLQKPAENYKAKQWIDSELKKKNRL